MSIFGSSASWSAQGKSAGGFFHPEKRCPPVKDCDVKNFLGSRRKPEPEEEKTASWPFKGSYKPRAKGR